MISDYFTLGILDLLINFRFMLISYDWLQSYFDKKLPKPEKLAEVITMRAYEVEDINKVGDDYVLDLDVLPSRTHDSLGHFGVARTVAVLLDLPLKLPNEEFAGDSGVSSADHINLSVEDPKLVPRATKRLVVDVKVGESPEWLKNRLLSLDQKPINNIVDITNYVMFETGQPVHAFDFDKLAPRQARGKQEKKNIIVRSAKPAERIKTLDGDEYELDENDLVIADSDKALDIAAIKGGINSEINEKTTRVMLSACAFNPVTIRKTSKRLGIRTDASTRFENGLTSQLPIIAMHRLSQLVSEIAGGKVAHDVLDVYEQGKVRTTAPYKIGVSLTEVSNVLGTNLSESDVTDILDRMTRHADFSWEKVKPREKILELAKKFL